MTRWTADDIPDLSDKVFVVTGANGGLGREIARALARKGAQVVMACRDIDKAGEAIKHIQGDVPDARLEPMPLDLADLSSVRAFAQTFRAEHARLHVLVNNAGVMALPYRKTADGFEMQIGTNHFGHFALTGLLLDRLLAAGSARVVTMSSHVHRIGRIDFDDLDGEKHYRKWFAYGQSKLANLLFTYELQRRFEAAGADPIAVACHPGYTSTNLALVGPRMAGAGVMEKMSRFSNRLAAQDAQTGALPALFAATDASVHGGDYIGPGGFMEMYGHPTRVRSSARSHDEKIAARLWEVSVERTGVRYEALEVGEAARA